MRLTWRYYIIKMTEYNTVAILLSCKSFQTPIYYVRLNMFIRNLPKMFFFLTYVSYCYCSIKLHTPLMVTILSWITSIYYVYIMYVKPCDNVNWFHTYNWIRLKSCNYFYNFALQWLLFISSIYMISLRKYERVNNMAIYNFFFAK